MYSWDLNTMYYHTRFLSAKMYFLGCHMHMSCYHVRYSDYGAGPLFRYVRYLGQC